MEIRKNSSRIIAVLAVLSLAILGGCSCSPKAEDQGTQTNQAENQTSSLAKPGLLALLMGKDGVKCQVEDEKGNYMVLAKEGKVKIDGINFMTPNPQIPPAKPGDVATQPKTGTMISDGKMLWMWSGKEGMSMNIEEAQKAIPEGAGNGPVEDWSKWAQKMEDSGAKYQCDPANISDSEFAPPQDVKFQDLSQLMKGLGNMIPANLQNQNTQEMPAIPPVKELPQ
jgi:hypothetical protein